MNPISTAAILLAALMAAGLILYGQAREPKQPLQLNPAQVERLKDFNPRLYQQGKDYIAEYQDGSPMSGSR